MPWWRDRRLLAILAVGVVLRVVPLALWPGERCVRDECTYINVAERLAAGEGITPSAGWLWAPGYPALLALHAWLTGFSSAIRITQIPVAVLNILLIYQLGLRLLQGWEEGPRRQAARAAAFLFAVSPTHVFYAINLWSETLYTAALLGALLMLDLARASAAKGWAPALRSAAVGGALLGVCVLFRGIATYALPVFGVGLLWGRLRSPRALAQGAAFVLALVLVVAPYSLYASKKFGSLIISDRTLGQMMWLGNNEYPPITFDYGNGQLSPQATDAYTSVGRPHCAEQDEVIARDTCETAAGIAWIKANPERFVRRIPMRIAQMMTPHSMLTRHLRWGHWRGIPQWGVEGILAWNASWSIAVILLGTVGLCLWASGPLGLTFAGILAYHVSAIAVLAGLSRYRVPLEPLLMIGLGALWTRRAEARAVAVAHPWRGALALVLFGALVPLVLWYLPAGWPQWRSW